MKLRRDRLRAMEAALTRRERELTEARRQAEAGRQAARCMEKALHSLLVRAALGSGTAVPGDGDRTVGWRLTLPPVEEPEKWSVKGWTDADGVSYLGVGLTDDPEDAKRGPWGS